MAKLHFNFSAILLLLSLASAALASTDFSSIANSPIESTLSKLDKAAGGDGDKLKCLKLLAKTSRNKTCINTVVDSLLNYGRISYRLIAYAPGCCEAFRKIGEIKPEGILEYSCMEKLTGKIRGEEDTLVLFMGCHRYRQ